MEAVKYFSGDLINGNLKEFSTYDEAFADYKEMAEGCAQTDRGDEVVSLEQAISESLDFHYVVKVTYTYDEDGDLAGEVSEILDGGTADIR